MGGGMLALDSILSASFHFVVKWSPELDRTKSRDLLRFLLCRLYDQNRGQLLNVQLQLAQTTLARKLGLSRQWVGILVQRLENAGWIEHYSPVLPDGTNGSTVWRIGRQLKRLLVMLSKSRRGKKPVIKPAKSTWRFSPTPVEKTLLSIQEKENQPPNPALLERIPLLRRWMDRGKENKPTQ
jgi:DNA-binding Lrp family transcriptional regulator